MLGQRRRMAFWGSLLLLVCVAAGSSAAAQLRSLGASIALVATLPDSVTLRPVSVRLPQSFTRGQSAPFEILAVFLHWQLKPGHSVQVQSTLATTEPARPPASPARFLSMRELALASHILVLLPPSETRPLVLAAITDAEEKPVGRAGLLLILPRPRQADGSEESGQTYLHPHGGA